MYWRWLFVCSLSVLIFNSVDFAKADDPVGLSAEEISAYPQPDITQLLPNEELLYDRIYKRYNEAADIFDAPNGQPIARLDAGFNFATIHAIEGDWAMVNDSQWVPTSLLQDATPSRYAGVLLEEEALPYPFAWVLVHTRASQQPGIEPLETDPLYLRYQLVNLYSSVEIDGWRWYQVGVEK